MSFFSETIKNGPDPPGGLTMNIFFMVNEIKMNKIWNGELIFKMKMFFAISYQRLQPLLPFIFMAE